MTLYETFSLALAVFQQHAPAFVQGIGASNFVPVFLDYRLDADGAALFFVVGGQEDDVAPQPRACALQLDHGGEVRGEHALVVDRPSAIEVAVTDDRAERIHRPLGWIDTDGVLMRDQQQRVRRVRQRAGL